MSITDDIVKVVLDEFKKGLLTHPENSSKRINSIPYLWAVGYAVLIANFEVFGDVLFTQASQVPSLPYLY